MIKTFFASTIEIDDPDDAIDDILSQIDVDELLPSTIGIIACHVDYITNGTIKALCAQLPFDTIGSTTYISDICGDADENQLSLFVLTGDDVTFATGVSASLQDCPAEKITALHSDIAKNLQEKAVFGIFFAPFLLAVSADSQIQALDEAAKGTPFFGTVALDYEENVRDPRTIYNGNDYTDCMVLLMVSGNVSPLFFVRSISEELFMKQKAIVTSSEGAILKEVNNMRAIDFLESLGLAKDGMFDTIPLVPLSVDIGDGGVPAARAMFAVTPDGYVVCGGDMPENATLGVGSFDSDDVQKTAGIIAGEISQSAKRNGAIIFSCMGRNRALGLDPMHEIEQIQATLGSDIPYLFMYSAGELYPDFVDGKPLNKALNDSIIACVF